MWNQALKKAPRYITRPQGISRRTIKAGFSRQIWLRTFLRQAWQIQKAKTKLKLKRQLNKAIDNIIATKQSYKIIIMIIDQDQRQNLRCRMENDGQAAIKSWLPIQLANTLRSKLTSMKVLTSFMALERVSTTRPLPRVTARGRRCGHVMICNTQYWPHMTIAKPLGKSFWVFKSKEIVLPVLKILSDFVSVMKNWRRWIFAHVKND